MTLLLVNKKASLRLPVPPENLRGTLISSYVSLSMNYFENPLNLMISDSKILIRASLMTLDIM